jgi:hypothetical protein
MKTKKVVWLSAFRHVVPADYEDWLEKLALQGWNIDRIGQWSSIYLVFRKTSPKRYRYVYDIQPNPRKDYRATYEQFGWECVGAMASCFLWRKEFAAERPQAFSDTQSIEDRNRRDIKAVSVSFILFATAFGITLTVFSLTAGSLGIGEIIQYAAGLALSGGIALGLAWVMRKLYRNLQK